MDLVGFIPSEIFYLGLDSEPWYCNWIWHFLLLSFDFKF